MYFNQEKYKEIFFGKYFGIPKKFILLLLIIGVVFGIYQIAKITIFAPKIVVDRTGQYLFKTVNIKDFQAGFGIQRETPNIVFQRNGTEIVIELPFRNMTWQKIKKGVQAQSQGYAYEYSILKDKKRKPVGIKEEIILEQPPNLSHFVFPITLKNLDPKQVKGVWRFFNVSGIEQFYIPELFMQDANGETSQDIEIEVNTEAGFIKITPSRQWLDDINRAYPVIIDPSIRIYQQTQEEKDLPNIINAYVDPIKVVPGDTMFVYAEIMDSHGISEVIADMGGIETINLELKQGTIYNGIWQTEWLVHDTGPREYTTIITATNKLGKSSSASIVWLDPSWLAGWDNRIKFTIDNTKVDDDLTHFPVTVFLDSTQGEEVFAELDNDNDYDQVAFTTDDGVTELYAEKELFGFESVSPTGGTITTNGDKTVHMFTENGTFTIPAGQSGNVECLVVAGGGGGGGHYQAGGGGGAGGVIENDSVAVTAQGYAIVIGAGGSGDNVSTNGNDSSVFELTAVGGGRGGESGINDDGGNGGSGGGGAFNGGSGGDRTSEQGYVGGDGHIDSSAKARGGGGGGAGEAGVNGGVDTGGEGGDGIQSNISGSLTYYAGGGGGGANIGGSGAPGGEGGGGDGGVYAGADGQNGTVNTGGGGGGGGPVTETSGGDGGSGIVIISYITANFLGDKAIYHISKTGWEISSSTDTDFYMYYDNDHADNTDFIGAIDTAAGASVWDSNFVMVQHMVDDTTSAIKDSTSNNNDGTKLDANDPIEAAGKVGQGQEFDGNEDYINCGAGASLNITGNLTIESIIESDNIIVSFTIVGKEDASNDRQYFFRTSSAGKLFFLLSADGTTYGSQSSNDVVFSNDTFYYVATAYTAGGSPNVDLYLDGTEIASTASNMKQSIISNEDTELELGSRRDATKELADGIIDEVRISSTPRTAAWLKATYNTLWDSLLTYGTEEEYVHPVPADFANRIKLTIDHTKIDSTLTHFPITVILSSTHGDSVFDHLASDNNRFKIAFTKDDGSTQLYGEIEKWDDASESAVIHVSASGWEISDSADTDFYMYYDSSLNDNFAYIGDIASTPGESVWDSNFKMVQHMKDYTTSTIKDSTSNNNDGTKKTASQYPPAHSDTYVKATTKHTTSFWAYFATDPALSLTGSYADNAWLSTSNGGDNERFHIDLGSAKVIRRIYYENSHHNGANTGHGAQNFTFWGSNDADDFADLVYVNNGTWTELTVSTNTMLEHIAEDQADPQYILVTNSTAYRYYAFKFVDNYGDPNNLGVRRIELQTVGANEPNEVNGKVGKGQDFEGVDEDFINISSIVNDVSSDTVGTISFWVNIGNEATVYHTLVGSANSVGGLTTFLIFNYIRDVDNWMQIQLYVDGTRQWGFKTATDSLNYGTWFYVTLVQDGTEPKLYWDGALREDITWLDENNKTKWLKAIMTDATTKADNFYIGGLYYNGAIETNTMDGIMDEVGYSSSARTPAWIKGEYNSGNDTLLTYGNEEEGTAPSISEFDNRIKLTIDPDKIDDDLSHFPVTVILSSTHGEEVFAELTSDANRFKIAFTEDDQSTQLYGEIEKWDHANESAVIHVSASGWEISSTTDTDFYMYYDKDVNNNTNTYIGDIDTTAGHSVWDGNFKAVYHMANGADNAHIYDSTSNNNDGTKDSANNPLEVAENVGQGQYFTSDEIIIPTLWDTFPTDVSIEVFVKFIVADNYQSLFLKTNISGQDRLYLYKNDANVVFFTGEAQNNENKSVTGIDELVVDTWYYIAGVHTANGAMKAYLNTTEYTGDTLGNIQDGAFDVLTFGSAIADMVVDEERLSSVARSSVWLKATYNSLWDSLLTYGTQEDNKAPTAPNTLYSNNANAQAGKENPTGITDTTPVFSAEYNDPDAGDIANKYRVQVATSSNFATSSIFWDSGSSGISMSNCAQGYRCQDVEYASTTVLGLDATKYYWRIKFWDGGTGWDGSEEGIWSEPAHFTMAYRELDTSTNTNTLRLGADRHTLYAANNYWAFYIDDNSHIVYEKSLNGTTWNETVTEIATSTTYTSLGVWKDDDSIWVAYNSTTTSYSKKITISDGALGAEYSTSTPDRYHPQIIEDSEGYLWRKEEEEGSASVTDSFADETKIDTTTHLTVDTVAEEVKLQEKDNTPDSFTFTDQTGVELSTLTTSDIKQIIGIDDGITVTISGSGSPEYMICDDSDCTIVDHNWSNSLGSIDNNQYLRLHLTSSANYETAYTADITVGTVSDNWSVTTRAETWYDVYGPGEGGQDLVVEIGDMYVAKWIDNPGTDSNAQKNWQDSIDYCSITLNWLDQTDWFLPSQNELGTICSAKGSLGAYSDFCWSSLVYDATNAWAQHFNTCNKNPSYKTTPNYLRCVRWK